MKKITEQDLQGKGVIGLPDTPGLSREQMQEKFEETARQVIVPAFNALVDELGGAQGASAIGINPIDGFVAKNVQEAVQVTKNKTDELTRSLAEQGTSLTQKIDEQGNTLNAKIDAQSNTLNAKIDAQDASLSAEIAAQETELKQYVDATVQKIGAADMQAIVYDPTHKAQDIFAYANAAAEVAKEYAEGIVAGTAPSRLFVLTCTTTGTTHALTGLNGAQGLLTCAFTADADFADGNTFTVDGTAYTIQMQDGSNAKAGLFVVGAKVQVLIDTEGQSVNFKSGGGYRAGDILPAAEVEEVLDPNSPTKLTGTPYTSVENARFAYEFTNGSVFTFDSSGGKMQATDANGEMVWSLGNNNKYNCVLGIDEDYIYTSSYYAFDIMFTVSKIDRRNGTVLLSCTVPSQTQHESSVYYYIRVTSYCDSPNFLWMYVQDAQYNMGAHTYLHNYDRIIRIAKSDLTLTTVWTGTQKPGSAVSSMENGTLREFALVGGYRNSDNIVVLTNPPTSTPDANEYYGIAVYDSSFSPLRSISLESYVQNMSSNSVNWTWTNGFVSLDETMVFIGGGYGAGHQSIFSLSPLELVQELRLSIYEKFNPNIERYMTSKVDTSTSPVTMTYTSYNLSGNVVWTHAQPSELFGSYGTENNEGTKMFYYNSSSKKLESIKSPIIGYKIKEA